MAMESVICDDVELKIGIYTDKELNAIIGLEMKSRMDSLDYILRTNKSERIAEMTISLDELNNSDNLKDGKPSNTLFTYYIYLVLKILGISNPTPLNIRPLKMA